MQFTIERLGHHGDGIARTEAGPVYAPLTLPGEVVEGEVMAGRMAAPRILTPSTDRVKAPCPHYRACGGCALQHASDAFVEGWKADIVRAALAGQGLEAPLRGVSTSPPRSRRRAAFSGRRTKSGALVGFHARASDTVVAIPDCRLVEPALIALLPVLERLTLLGASRKGEVTLTVTRTENGPDVAVRDAKTLDPNLSVELARLAEEEGLSRLTWEGEVVALRAPPSQRFGKALVQPAPGAFLQATDAGEAALLASVREAVGPARRIADLFAGAGTFSLPLAEAAEVHAFEGEAAAMAALSRGWRQAKGLHRVTTEIRDLFRRPLVPEELRAYDAVVIDPPRAGAEAQSRELAASTVPVIAAVSCNPTTFARDARILAESGFRIDWIDIVDQFRWSTHVELSARLSRQ